MAAINSMTSNFYLHNDIKLTIDNSNTYTCSDIYLNHLDYIDRKIDRMILNTSNSTTSDSAICWNWNNNSTATTTANYTNANLSDLTINGEPITISGSSDYYIDGHLLVLKSPAERLREILRSRATPAIQTGNRNVLSPTTSQRELNARATLERILGPRGMRRYHRDGFVSVQNRKSGRVYQIFPGSGMTSVYEQGKMIAKLCVILRGDYPPTDSLIVRYLLAINDEKRLWELANRWSPSQWLSSHLSRPTVDLRPLPEIYRELQVAA